MENKTEKKGLSPVNQRGVYLASAKIFEKLMNDEITPVKAEAACRQLENMNRSYALEIKRAYLLKEQFRTIELDDSSIK